MAVSCSCPFWAPGSRACLSWPSHKRGQAGSCRAALISVRARQVRAVASPQSENHNNKKPFSAAAALRCQSREKLSQLLLKCTQLPCSAVLNLSSRHVLFRHENGHSLWRHYSPSTNRRHVRVSMARATNWPTRVTRHSDIRFSRISWLQKTSKWWWCLCRNCCPLSMVSACVRKNLMPSKIEMCMYTYHRRKSVVHFTCTVLSLCVILKSITQIFSCRILFSIATMPCTFAPV